MSTVSVALPHQLTPLDRLTARRGRHLRPVELRGLGVPAAIRVAIRAALYLEEVDSGKRPPGHLRTLYRPELAARLLLHFQSPTTNWRPRTLAQFRSIGPVQITGRAETGVCNAVLLFIGAGRTFPVGLELRPRNGDWEVVAVVRPGRAGLPRLPAGWGDMLEDDG